MKNTKSIKLTYKELHTGCRNAPFMVILILKELRASYQLRKNKQDLTEHSNRCHSIKV